jgi:protein-S-isoprenylcysteine O-methyltransferase Ste14
VIARIGHVLFRYRVAISPALLLLLFLPGPDVFADPFLAAIAGLCVALAGQLVRGTTIGLDYIVRGGRDRRVYADDLVTDGLFAHTRNPMYVGKFLMALGAGVAANSWPALLAIPVAYAAMYGAVVLAEEEYLRGKFGAAFDEYCARTPRWLPRLEGLRATFARSQFDWHRVIVKEYSAPLGWTLPIVTIGLYNLSRVPDTAGGTAQRWILIALLATAVTAWLWGGWIKKAGTLGRRVRRLIGSSA